MTTGSALAWRTVADDSHQHSPPRAATRAPVDLSVRLQFDDSMEIVDAHCNNISIGGMFVDQVGVSRPSGTLVRFELQIAAESSIRGLSEVVWMRPRDGGAMGLKFRFLEQRDRQQIFKLVSQHIKERLAQRHPSLDEREDAAAGAAARGGTIAEVLTPPSVLPDGAPPPAPTTSSVPDAKVLGSVDRFLASSGDSERAIPRTGPESALPGSAAPGVAALAPDPATEPEPADPLDETGARTHLFEAGASQRPGVFASDEPDLGSEPEPVTAEPAWDEPPWTEPALGEPDDAPRSTTSPRRGSVRGVDHRLALWVAGVLGVVVLAALGYLALGWFGGEDSSTPEVAAAADAIEAAGSPASGSPASGEPASGESAEAGLVDTDPADTSVADGGTEGDGPKTADTRPAQEPPAASAPGRAEPASPPPPRVAAPARSFERVTAIRSRTTGAAQVIVIETDGAVPGARFDHFRLDGGSGPREVVRLYGLSRRFERNTVAVDGPAVRQIRTGWHEARRRGNELHIVLDLVGPAWRVTRLEPVGDRLEVTVER
ncbi:MAG: PilZ domain-containing protein [Acidobacteriota bacterium]